MFVAQYRIAPTEPTGPSLPWKSQRERFGTNPSTKVKFDIQYAELSLVYTEKFCKQSTLLGV